MEMKDHTFYGPDGDSPLMKSEARDLMRDMLIGELRNYRWPTNLGGSFSVALVTGSRDNTLADGSVSYAHSLGKIPSAIVAFSADNVGSAGSQGAWDGTAQSCAFTSALSSGTDITHLIRSQETGTARQRGTASASASAVTVAWAKSGSPSGITFFILALLG